MRRKLAGVLLIVHGLAHTLPGMRATEGPVRWSMTLAWVLAVIGFVAAGCMLLGLRGLNGTWRRYATGGLVGSAVLLLLGWPDRLAVAGLAIDAVILCGVLATRSTDEVIGGIGPEPESVAARDRLVIVALAPLGLLLFEPIHFLMERKMLLTIKRLAEKAQGVAGSRS